jgi:NodT family efflux transporter outer membrane factor (OMF) lipoprotein
VLAALEREVDISNQTLKASEATVRQLRAVVAEARAGYYPTVDLSASAQRSGTPSRSSGTSASRSFGSNRIVQNQFGLAPAASWVPDIWGRIARTVESDVANAQASAADLAAARLSVQTALAIDYFELRINDAEKRVLETTVAAYQQSLAIVRNQFQAGTVAETDVANAETQLANAQAQLVALGLARATLEHAIAVLVGKPPAEFSLAPAPVAAAVPVVPPGVPSALLERRPDIAASERAMAAANAEIGLAETAYFPDLTLSASVSFASTALENLLSVSNAAWTIGSAASETVFEGGLRRAQVEAARAFYDGTVANYRQTVLTAFQQVEDQLASLRILDAQAQAQARALAAARRAEELALNQYQAGTVAFTTVIVAQTTALGDELSALSIKQSRLIASASLVEALGGGWDRSQLPTLDAAAP